MRRRTRGVVLLVAVIPAAVFAATASSQVYPERPIRFVVPFAPGGNTDILARIVAQKLGARLGQQVVVDNRGGAGGTIGTDIVAKASPDGYTLLMHSASHVVNPSLYKELPYDSINGFASVSLVADVPNLLVAHPAVPTKSVTELVALAKAQPGALNYGSAGSGTGSHLAFELFKSMAGIDIQHVPYRGNAPATADLLAGQVQFMMGAQPAAMPHVKAGRVRALGVTGAKRSPALPDVPAIGETVPGYKFSGGFGIIAPAGTPKAVITKLNREINEILRQRDVSERLAGQGAVPAGNTPEEYGRYLKSEIAKMAEVVKASGARID